jgi:ubiquinone/menaquinone biosynthesis C-methylase UbiE
VKDYFSTQSKVYAAFRPTYPRELYEFIFKQVEQRDRAWDCATGNGQVATYLSSHFREVFATDISQQQLDHATFVKNVQYSVCPAERTNFPDDHFDLITVAQALHWFDRDSFYKEVLQVGKPNAILAVWGYAFLCIDPEIDKLIMEFYNKTVGPYWDDARRLVEQQYKTITFPFEEIPTPAFSIQVQWTIDQLSGYLQSWSATQKYIKENGDDPVPKFILSLSKYWKNPVMEVSFPIFTRIGRIQK